MFKTVKFWIRALFVAYGLWMLWLLFGQRVGQSAGSWNLEPFDTLWRYIWVLKYSTDGEQRLHAVINLAGNVVMFVPLGFFVPCIWRRLRNFAWHFLTMTGIIVIIELLQLVTQLGTCDIDDLMLNLVGTTTGLGFYHIARWILHKYMAVHREE